MRGGNQVYAAPTQQRPIAAVHFDVEQLAQLEGRHEFGHHALTERLPRVLTALLTLARRTAHTACNAIRRRVKTRRRAHMRPA